MITVHPIDKDTAKVFRWVNQATSKDRNHDLIRYIYIGSDVIEATDGFSIHRARFKELAPLENFIEPGLYRVVSIDFTHKLILLEKYQGEKKFPGTEKIWSELNKFGHEVETNWQEKMRLMARYAINPSLLTRALDFKQTGPLTPSWLSFQAPNHIYHLTVTEWADTMFGPAVLEALIMPMHADGKKAGIIPAAAIEQPLAI